MEFSRDMNIDTDVDIDMVMDMDIDRHGHIQGRCHGHGNRHDMYGDYNWSCWFLSEMETNT